MKLSFPKYLSLRAKITMNMVLLSLVSIATVGWFANNALMAKFEDAIRMDAGRRFSREVAAYIRTYGGWEEGLRHETFRNFAERNAPVINRPPVGVANPAPVKDGGASAAPPPGGPVPPGGAVNYAAPAPDITTVAKGSAPPPYISNLSRPPFRFYLFDTHFHALFRIPPYELGDRANLDHSARLIPIREGEETVAYFLPEGKVNYSDLDLAYIDAMHSALWLGAAAAAVIAVLAGMGLSYGLSRNLRALTRAAESMDTNTLGQRVEIKSQDEVGTLARAFNDMSGRLFAADKDLRESHARIAEQAAQLEELAVHDGLTDLYNRRYFDEQAGQMLRLAQRRLKPFSVMIGDVDFFKRINDSLSHASGDEVLKRIAKILASNLRNTDLLARYGGEEFVIAFPETALEQAFQVCENLRAQIEAHPWHEVAPELRVTMSMGLCADIKVADLDEMLRLADALLYQAKEGGRNRVCA